MEDFELSLEDLAAVINIIDLVSERGSFKGSELLFVGSVREKVGQYIVQEQRKAKEAMQQPELPPELLNE